MVNDSTDCRNLSMLSDNSPQILSLFEGFLRLGIAMQTKRYYNGFENQIMTGGALIEKLRVRYSLDPLNLLGNASVGSVYISYILYNDTKDYRKHLPVADAFSCFTEALKEISIRRK